MQKRLGNFLNQCFQADVIQNAETALPNVSQIYKSVLFVPCSNAKALNKTHDMFTFSGKFGNHPTHSIPDAIILDLEDSVAPSQKKDARHRLRDYFNARYQMSLNEQQKDLARKKKVPNILIRINSVRHTPQWGWDDLDCVLHDIYALYHPQSMMHRDDNNGRKNLDLGLRGICLPKVETQNELQLISESFFAKGDGETTLFQQLGVKSETFEIWPFIETPKGVIDSHAILKQEYDLIGKQNIDGSSVAHENLLRWSGVIVGSNDLSAELQLPMFGNGLNSTNYNKVMETIYGDTPNISSEKDNETVASSVSIDSMLSPVRSALGTSLDNIVLAAQAVSGERRKQSSLNRQDKRCTSFPVLDGVFNDVIQKASGIDVNLQRLYRAECYDGRKRGMQGKTLIHPSQVEDCNIIFSPTQTEIMWARKVVEAVDSNAGGVAVINGKMVEELHARRAREVLASIE